MQPNKFFEQVSVGAIILGTADGKSGPVILERFGVDGKQDDKVIGHKRRDNGTTRGLNGNGYGTILEALAHLSNPAMQSFGGLFQDPVFVLGTVGRLDPKVMLLVSPIQSHGGFECSDSFHVCIWFSVSTQALSDGSTYRGSSPQSFCSCGRKVLSIPLQQGAGP